MKTTQEYRDEAARAVEAIGERYFTTEALEACIKTFAAHIYDLTERLDLHETVAHAAWHVLDDGGEDANDEVLWSGTKLQAERLSDALDALEAAGWAAHVGDSA